MSVDKVSNNCCGCTACYNVCPKNAIRLIFDESGFIVPQVDNDLCVGCNLCEKVCSACQNIPELNEVHSVFAAKSANEQNHRTSQSGGVAFEISRSFLGVDNSIVYGAAFDSNFEVQHIGINNANDLNVLQGSKYVQSNLAEVFNAIENLIKDKRVLFIGTPCQVYALKEFCTVKKLNMANLFTCDLVCYGVSSPGVFKDWINVLEQGKESKLVDMSFRDPADPWRNGKEKYLFANGETLRTKVYLSWYFGDFITRTSCDRCKFCSIKRAGDITLGDFWGISDCIPDFADEHGVSLVLVNSDKGEYLWEKTKSNLNYQYSDINSAKIAQTRFDANEKKINTANKERFWKIYRKYGMRYLAEENGIFEPRFSIKVRWKINGIKSKLLSK